jgi:hypothetical protein
MTVTPNDHTLFVLSASVTSLRSDSFTVQWSVPHRSQSITGYRIWASIAKAHNGYNAELKNTLVYATELRPHGQMLRTVVGPSKLSYAFTGCYNTPDSGSHCIAAWTLYEVHIEPITAVLDGAPVVLTVLTAEDAPAQPSELTAVSSTVASIVSDDRLQEAVTTTSIELQWKMPYLTGPLQSFEIEVQSAGSGAKFTRM